MPGEKRENPGTAQRDEEKYENNVACKIPDFFYLSRLDNKIFNYKIK